MAEIPNDSARRQDTHEQHDGHEALINRLAKEQMMGAASNGGDLLSFNKAPENQINKYTSVTLNGLSKVPEGMFLAAQHNLQNPLQLAETLGMGAATAVALKTLLPEGGLAGKLAGAAIGVYFTYQAAEPIFDGYKKAGSATTMGELNSASTQIGYAGGQFLVDTAIAATGYKIGAHYTGRVLSSQRMDGFADAKANFYDKLGSGARSLTDAVGFTKRAPGADTIATPQVAGNIEPRMQFAASERAAPQGFLKGDVDPTKPMELSVILKSKGTDLRMNRTLERIAQGRQQPLTDAQMLDQFGASKESLAAITKFASEHGLSVGEANLTSGRVVIKGTAGQLSDAFQTRLAAYESHSGQAFTGREGSLNVPRELNPHLVSILGMDDRPAARSYIKYADAHSPAAAAEAAKAGEAPKKFAGPNPPENAPLPPEAPPPETPPSGGQTEPNARRGFMPNEVADAYNFPKESMGKGQAVGIIQLGGGFDAVDNAKYYQQHGLPEPKVKVIEVGGAKNSPGQAADGEVMLDSQVIGTVAPEAQQHMIFAPNSEKGFTDAILRATFPEAGETQNSAISISWGMNEEGWTKQAIDGMSQAFKKAMLKGISVFAASGDDGARDNASGNRFLVDYPASDPMVTGAGGTRLTVDGSGKRSAEVVWNNNRANDAGGGGISQVFPPQDFQAKVGVPRHAQTGEAGRGVPDVAGNADPVTGYRIRVAGSETLTGGTSAVSPLYSALMLRVNGALDKPFGKPLNPWLYERANSGIFNDISVGDNSGYKATPGWDATTGLGSIDGTKLLNAIRENPNLAGPRLMNMKGFAYIGPAGQTDYPGKK